jgi:hypothetical protein
MASGLRSKRASAVSACGKILRPGQTVSVPQTAVGPREEALVSQGKLRVRTSNRRDWVQITCLLKG